jgi:hypothetical protein
MAAHKPGGGQPLDSWLVLRCLTTQTFVRSGSFAGGNVAFGQEDGAAGTDLSWTIGDPTNVHILTDGVYSACATLFFVKDATSPTAVWTAQIQAVTDWVGSFVNPVYQATYSDAGYFDGPTVSAAFPYMRLAAGDMVNIPVDCEGVSSNQTLQAVEFGIGRLI